MERDQEFETVRDVVHAGLEMHSRHEAPTPREVLALQIRHMCAQAGMPKPDFESYPAHDRADSYFDNLHASEG